MHTRKKSRHGRHAVPGNRQTVPAEWQLVLWLGIVVAAIGLAVLAPVVSDKIGGFAPTGWSGAKATSSSVNFAASYAPAAPPIDPAAMNCADLQTVSEPSSPPSPKYTIH